MNTVILLDNIFIGGIQRLALDQAYQITESRGTCTVLVLNQKLNSGLGTFIPSEGHFLKQKKIRLLYITGSRKRQAIQLYKFLRTESIDIVIAHSLRGGLISFLLRPLVFRRFSISTTIHQLPSFSKKSQRLKRMFYSQFTDKLFIFSSAALADWISERKENYISRMITIRREPKLCRNGVYLPRLILGQSKYNSEWAPKRLVFIGRLTEWKGFNIFLTLIKSEELKKFEILIVVPSDPSIDLLNLPKEIRSRITFTISKSISEIEFKSGDIHIYPVINSSSYVESISINVLEMAALGIPSLVTINGSGTWPELVTNGLVIEVDWSNLEMVSSLITKMKFYLPRDKVLKTRELLDVKNNLMTVLQ